MRLMATCDKLSAMRGMLVALFSVGFWTACIVVATHSSIASAAEVEVAQKRALPVSYFPGSASHRSARGRLFGDSRCQCSSCSPGPSVSPSIQDMQDLVDQNSNLPDVNDIDSLDDFQLDPQLIDNSTLLAGTFGAAAGPSSAASMMMGDFFGLAFSTSVSAASNAGFGTVPSLVSPYLTRTFKIAEGQSAVPMDRLIGRFSYFNRVERNNNHLFRYSFGFEKTFLDGQASIQMQVPIFTVDPAAITSADSSAILSGRPISTFSIDSGDRSSFGDLSITLKYALVKNKRFVFSSGITVVTPTGPATIGGVNPVIVLVNPSLIGNNNAERQFTLADQYIRHYGSIQPFVAFYHALGGSWFLRGFSTIDAPFDQNDSTWMFNDIGLGYLINRPRSRWITAVVPTIELHVNSPLNNDTVGVALRSDVSYSDGSGFSTLTVASGQLNDQVNFTSGVTLGLGGSRTLALGAVIPMAGPKPFDWELQTQLNIFGW